MGKDRKNEWRSRSRERSREKEKEHHKKRDHLSSSQKQAKRHKKHKEHHKEHHQYSESYQRKEKQQIKEEKVLKEQIIKQLPCWEPSGILLQFYNSRDGVSLKFHQPPEAREPTQTWKIYIFKGDQVQQPIDLVNSCYLIGKDERICDILCLNPSISRQHSVIQFRMISKMNIEGDYSQSIRPYVMDLGSTNGTFLNDEKLQSSRYVELLHKDVLRFGFSDRLYVLVKSQDQRENMNEDE